MLDTSKDPIKDTKKLKANEIQYITEVNAGKIHIIGHNVLYAEQIWDITCKITSFSIPL